MIRGGVVPHPPVAVVTGGAGGIGRAVVRELAADGCRVFAIVRTLPSDPDPACEYVIADVSSLAEMSAATGQIMADFGRIDVLVTAAAVLSTSPIHEMKEDMWDEVVDVNLKGVFTSCRTVLPFMIAAGRGSIVNLSSVHAYASVPGTGAYAATKGAIISLSRQMAVEYADAGIRVNSVVIGSVDTAMTERHKDLVDKAGITLSPPAGRLGRMAHPREIAKAVGFLAGDASSFVTGSAVTVDGGLLSSLM